MRISDMVCYSQSMNLQGLTCFPLLGSVWNQPQEEGSG
jgi:hypothetical protein